MAKGYWVAHVNVDDPDKYEAYRAANAVPFKKYGARFLVRGGSCEVMEGEAKPRTVVIEFKDYETAMACYQSPEYQAAYALRKDISQGDLVIVEGYEEA